MNKRLAFAIALVAVAVMIPGGAHEGATGIVKERMYIMKGIKDDRGEMREMVRGEQRYTKGKFMERVQTVKAVSADIPALFPAGSTQKPSEALPAIWDNWDDFTARSNRFHELVLSLETAVEGGDRNLVKSSFRDLARTCKGCHDDYKAD